MFTSMYNGFVNMFGSLLSGLAQLFDYFFTTSVSDLLFDALAGVGAGTNSVIAKIVVGIFEELAPEVLDYTLASFFLGYGVVLFIGFTLLKWFLDIVL